MKKQSNILGLIPARSGSKSIPRKNIAPLGGKPLIEWVMDAGISSKLLDLLVVSSDMPEVFEICERKGIKYLERPEKLCGDDVPIIDVVNNVLMNTCNEIEAVALLQPTSPFVTGGQIDICIGLLRLGDFKSVQTITNIPHNYHAFNQRNRWGGLTSFNFEDEREVCYNKQTKPELHAFGNLVVTRQDALVDGLFAKPSGWIWVDRYHAIDVDGPEDLELAEWYVEKGKV